MKSQPLDSGVGAPDEAGLPLSELLRMLQREGMAAQAWNHSARRWVGVRGPVPLTLLDYPAAACTPEREHLLRWGRELPDPESALEIAAIMLLAARAAEGERLLHQSIAAVSDAMVVGQAKSLLADAFVLGLGGALDAAQARDFYVDAARVGLASGALGLGTWFEARHARFASPVADYQLAAQFYEEAAAGGCVVALTRVAHLHLKGLLRHSSWRKGVELLRQASDRGDFEAGERLRDLGAQGTAARVRRAVAFTRHWWDRAGVARASLRLPTQRRDPLQHGVEPHDAQI